MHISHVELCRWFVLTPVAHLPPAILESSISFISFQLQIPVDLKVAFPFLLFIPFLPSLLLSFFPFFFLPFFFLTSDKVQRAAITFQTFWFLFGCMTVTEAPGSQPPLSQGMGKGQASLFLSGKYKNFQNIILFSLVKNISFGLFRKAYNTIFSFFSFPYPFLSLIYRTFTFLASQCNM